MMLVIQVGVCLELKKLIIFFQRVYSEATYWNPAISMRERYAAAAGWPQVKSGEEDS